MSSHGKQIGGEELLRKAGRSLRTDYIWGQEWSIPILRKTNRCTSKVVWLSWELVVEQHKEGRSRLQGRTLETLPRYTGVLSTKLMLCWRRCLKGRERAARWSNFSRKRPVRWGCGCDWMLDLVTVNTDQSEVVNAFSASAVTTKSHRPLLLEEDWERGYRLAVAE